MKNSPAGQYRKRGGGAPGAEKKCPAHERPMVPMPRLSSCSSWVPRRTDLHVQPTEDPMLLEVNAA